MNRIGPLLAVGLLAGCAAKSAEPPPSSPAQDAPKVPADKTAHPVAKYDAATGDVAAALAGKYYMGDGLGFNQSLTLAQDGTFDCRWTGCLGEYGKCSGTWWKTGERLVLRTKSREGKFEDRPLADHKVAEHEGKTVLKPIDSKPGWSDFFDFRREEDLTAR
jgi:hypothetical protein